MVEETERRLAIWGDGDVRDVHADLSPLTWRSSAGRFSTARSDRRCRRSAPPRPPDRPLRLPV
jgi:hypothetical protein